VISLDVSQITEIFPSYDVAKTLLIDPSDQIVLVLSPSNDHIAIGNSISEH